MQREKQTSAWGSDGPNLELISCLSSPDFFRKAVERMVSNHCTKQIKEPCLGEFHSTKEDIFEKIKIFILPLMIEK